MSGKCRQQSLAQPAAGASPKSGTRPSETPPPPKLEMGHPNVFPKIWVGTPETSESLPKIAGENHRDPPKISPKLGWDPWRPLPWVLPRIFPRGFVPSRAQPAPVSPGGELSVSQLIPGNLGNRESAGNIEFQQNPLCPPRDPNRSQPPRPQAPPLRLPQQRFQGRSSGTFPWIFHPRSATPRQRRSGNFSQGSSPWPVLLGHGSLPKLSFCPRMAPETPHIPGRSSPSPAASAPQPLAPVRAIFCLIGFFSVFLIFPTPSGLLFCLLLSS